MDEDEISSAMEAYPLFRGVYARDEIPHDLKRPGGIIVNTDPRSNPGSHWIAIYLDNHNTGELFDSLASEDVLSTFKDWMERNTTSYLFPLIPLQSSISKLCGVYCITFLAMRFENWSFSNIINCFAQNPLNNDIFLYNIMKGIKENKESRKTHSTQDDGPE